jgi:hypothetical protein
MSVSWSAPLSRTRGAAKPHAILEPACGDTTVEDAHANETRTRVSASPDARSESGSRAGDNAPAWNFAALPVFSSSDRRTLAPRVVHSREFEPEPALALGEADDALEREADRVASGAAGPAKPGVSPASAAAPISRAAMRVRGDDRADDESGRDSKRAPDIVRQVLRSPGQPLDLRTRSLLEPRFGQDFSGIRIHTDGSAARSAAQVGARAYTAGNDLVFAAGAYDTQSRHGRQLLSHELAHAVQQGSTARIIQRAPVPANYLDGSNSSAQSAAKPKPLQFSNDEWIWMLVELRRESPHDFVNILSHNESVFYPLLEPYGFAGSWVKEHDYLTDFDAAIRKWGRASVYSGARVHLTPPQPQPKSPEERRYQNARFLMRDFNRHGYNREYVNEQIESLGLMDDLKEHGFAYSGRWGWTEGAHYTQLAADALYGWCWRYEISHGIHGERAAFASVPSQGEDIEYYRAWLEGLGYITNSVTAAVFAGAAMKFTDDPRKITAAAGLGEAFEGAAGAAAMRVAGKGSYAPDVENKPGSAYGPKAWGQPIDPVKADSGPFADAPARDRIPTPDAPANSADAGASHASAPAKPQTPPVPDALAPQHDRAVPAPAADVRTPGNTSAAHTSNEPDVVPEVKPVRAKPKSNPPIDSKRQVAAKNRLEQTQDQRLEASREQASAQHSRESAKERLSAATAARKPLPSSLRATSRRIYAVADLDDRLTLVDDIRRSRNDWSPEERAWLDWQAELYDAQAAVEAGDYGVRKHGANARDAAIQAELRKKELARASASVADLVRSKGPNYASNLKLKYDQIMGEAAWDALNAGRRAQNLRALELNTDHLVSVREIRDEVVSSGLLELHDKGTPAVKAEIEKAIQTLGDESENLVRMEKVANQTLKSDRSWADVKDGEVSALYTPDQLAQIRQREAKMRLHFKTVIRDIVTRFKK